MKGTGVNLYSNASTASVGKRMGLAALLCASALSSPFAAAPALAQDAAAGNSNDIIVTAQRRAERLEDVPMSVAVVSQETLSSLGVNSVRDLQNVTSGFMLNNSGSVPQPAIRGVTSTTAGQYENNVALFIDGLYQMTSAVLNMDLPNVQNIQILKGPQGTLYGRNATGGAILIDTIDPQDSMEGSVEATYGRFDDKRLRGYISGPIADRIGFSIAGTLRRTDGYYKRASRTTPGEFDGRFLGLKQESVRAKLKFDATDNFRATLGYNYLRSSDPRGVFFTPVENVSNSYAVPGRDTRPTGLGEAAGDVFKLDLKQHEGSLKLELDTGIGMLRSITGYTHGETQTTYDSSGTYVPDVYIDAVVRDRTWQESLDFSVNALDNLDLIVGGNYYHIKTDYLPGRGNVVYLGPASIAPYTYPDPATTTVPLNQYIKAQETVFFRTKEAWAIFADATFHVTDKLSLNVGGRYSKESQDVSAFKNFYNAGVAIPVYSRTDSARSSSYKKFTPRASIRYEITPHTSVYASYSKGFRGGEWNSTPPVDSDFANTWIDAKQETIDAFEVGLKSAGRRLRFDLSAFYYDYKDLQLSNTVFIGDPPLTVVTLQNAPSAEIYGAEGNVQFDVTDNFTVRAGATWLHARYGDEFIYTGTGVNPNVPAFNTNSDPLKASRNVPNVAQDLSGMQMARAPNFSGYIGAEYNIPNKDGGLRFAVNLKYTDSYVVTDPSVWGGDPTYDIQNPVGLPDNTVLLAGTDYENRANQQRARQSNYALLNASVTWTDPSDHYYVRIWGNNLTDVTYRTHYRPSSSTYIPVSEPLTFGGTIGAKF